MNTASPQYRVSSSLGKDLVTDSYANAFLDYCVRQYFIAIHKKVTLFEGKTVLESAQGA